MITKKSFIENVLWEIGIIKHLAGKVTAQNLEYKPTEKQRTTIELLGYLAVGPGTSLQVIKDGDTSHYKNSREEQQKVTLKNFNEMIDKEGLEIKTALEAMTDDELNEEIDLWKSGKTQARSEYLLHLILESLVAYKMQLFLYLKSSGNEHLNTQNLWHGKDSEIKN
jgi:hypothetical protein